jgi:hypothetical protein
MRVVSPALDELTKLHAASRDIDPLRPYGPEQTLADDNHTDPVPGFEGRWLAGFAPVGHTGYAVIVQTRYEAPLELPRRALFSMLGWCGAALGLGAALVFVAARLLGSAARGRRRLA